MWLGDPNVDARKEILWQICGCVKLPQKAWLSRRLRLLLYVTLCLLDQALIMLPDCQAFPFLKLSVSGTNAICFY